MDKTEEKIRKISSARAQLGRLHKTRHVSKINSEISYTKLQDLISKLKEEINTAISSLKEKTEILEHESMNISKRIDTLQCEVENLKQFYKPQEVAQKSVKMDLKIDLPHETISSQLKNIFLQSEHLKKIIQSNTEKITLIEDSIENLRISSNTLTQRVNHIHEENQILHNKVDELSDLLINLNSLLKRSQSNRRDF
jgi:FtsZ-binding cell division protein ZapB